MTKDRAGGNSGDVFATIQQSSFDKIGVTYTFDLPLFNQPVKTLIFN
jgi:hypothetical protein